MHQNNSIMTMKVVGIILVAAAAAAWPVAGELSMGYYYDYTKGGGCPMAEMIVRDVVGDAIAKDPTLAASILRLHFHDCWIQGCDASLLLDSQTPDDKAEKDAPPNRTLRGFEVIDAVKEALEAQCPSVVSCADILALAARDAVVMSGGPYYDVPTGRRDGFRSVAADAEAGLPAATLEAAALVELFGSRGFTVPELVALSGAHTLGVAHCANFKNRLSNFDSVNDVDPSLEPTLAASLASTCGVGGDGATATLDTTSQAFDADYFRGLQRRRGLLTSDQTLAESPETRMAVNMFARSPRMFFYTFRQGMLKMGDLDLKDDSQGDVRTSCRRLN